MRKIIMGINVTPDGFCDHRSAIADDELHQFFSDILKKADSHIFGRKTFQLMESYWPGVAKNNIGSKADIEFARLIDNIQKIVFSKSGIRTNWKHTVVWNEINRDVIMKLKQMPGKDILVGGPSIIDQMAPLGVIDEYYYLVHPIIAGNGKRFFETHTLTSNIKLSLMDTRVLNSGVIALHYRAAN